MRLSHLLGSVFFVGGVLSILFAHADISAKTSDGRSVLLKENGTWSFQKATEPMPGSPKFGDDHFFWKNGYGELVKVEFYDEFDELGRDSGLTDDQLMSCATRALIGGKSSLQNPLSFVPVSLVLMEIQGQKLCYLTMRAKNAFGAESETGYSADVKAD